MIDEAAAAVIREVRRLRELSPARRLAREGVDVDW